ncbi:hypothetical protein BSKO_12168 [Bryopsis sp. KO-2023]|nr:hypothetical protein BSKO_12168 [Bryopsis sp. KO-2023]
MHTPESDMYRPKLIKGHAQHELSRIFWLVLYSRPLSVLWVFGDLVAPWTPRRCRKKRQMQGEERTSGESMASGFCGPNPSREVSTEFPSNVLVRLFAKLPGHIIARCACVSKRWNEAANGEVVWLQAFRRDFGPLPHSRAGNVVHWKKEYQLEYAWRYDTTVEPTILLDVDEYAWCALRRGNSVGVGGPQYFKIWDLENQVVACRCDVGNSDICSICFCGELLLGGDDKGNLRGWDLGTLDLVFNEEAHEGTVQAMANIGGFIVSGGGDGLIKLWDKTVWECRRCLSGHERSVSSLCGTSEGFVVSGSMDCTIRLWDPDSGMCSQVLQGHEGGVLCLASFEGVLVSGSEDTTIRVWNIDQGECFRILNGHDAEVWAISFDGKRIGSGSGDETVKLWDVEDGVCYRTFEVGEWVRGVWWEGDLLATFGSIVHVWKFGQGQ